MLERFLRNQAAKRTLKANTAPAAQPYYCDVCPDKACFFTNVYDTHAERRVYPIGQEGNKDGRHYLTRSACEWFKEKIFPKRFGHIYPAS